ncbi:hypothetical protein J1605_005848 [Eschrichtius robustus]|uniref:Multidrug resistance-associated protein 4 n=1 Tax=Eschrichtius robustus TaxID=9764 RepID=A0AB34H3C1_ESCRO|nr:hypothetical protein J1605_005848 [Eschrichtius robustus]
MILQGARDPDSFSLVAPLHVALTQLVTSKAQAVGWMKVPDVVTFHRPGCSHVATPICSGGWRERASFQAARCQLKSGVCHLRGTRADFEDNQQSLSATRSQFLVGGPVLCHLIPEGLKMAFLSVFLNFLLLDEISQCNPQLPSDGKTIVDVQDFTAFWDEDLEVLEDGDLTVIGDRGTTLSGGQKARVSLARAVYQDADIYLLDDPLSAVDAEVSRHLLELCIRQALHKKITILVTHQLQYLKDASQILVLKDTENIQVRLPLESYSEGRVHFKTYMNYFTSDAHWLIIIFFILVNIAARVAYVLQDWWLSYWANGQSTLYAMVYGKGNLIVVPDPDWYFTVYSVLTVGTVLFGITRSLLIFCVLVNSSQIWHDKMLESILRVPVLFFDTNPIGKSDTKFLSIYVLLMHLVPDYI